MHYSYGSVPLALTTLFRRTKIQMHRHPSARHTAAKPIRQFVKFARHIRQRLASYIPLPLFDRSINLRKRQARAGKKGGGEFSDFSMYLLFISLGKQSRGLRGGWKKKSRSRGDARVNHQVSLASSSLFPRHSRGFAQARFLRIEAMRF